MSPSDAEIERVLRDTVTSFYAAERFDDLTVKRVRKAAEDELGLSDGFLKSHEQWNARSKEVISAEVEAQEQVGNKVAGPNVKQASKKGATAAKEKPVARKTKQASAAAPTKKRRSPAPVTKSRKRAKVSPPPEAQPDDDKAKVPAKTGDDSDSLSSVEDQPSHNNGPEPAPTPSKSEVVKPDQEKLKKEVPERGRKLDDDATKNDTLKKDGPNKHTEITAGGDDSDSSLSSLIDEAPPKKKRQRQKKTADSEKPSKTAKPAKRKSKNAADVNSNADSQEQEIKRLQGWLIKCGIRKMWHRELAPYDTPRAKAEHLRGMLRDAGMEGRFSLDKAREIRERREMAADLEAVTEGNRRWGKSEGEDGGASDEEGSAEQVPSRRRGLARGLKDIAAFLDDDGEETD